MQRIMGSRQIQASIVTSILYSLATAAYPMPPKAAENPADPAVVRANSDFAVDLYRQLAKENQGKNLFFSPYSMSSALTMTAEGARGETAEQMGKVLRFPESARSSGVYAQSTPWNLDSIHAGMAALNQQFVPKPVSAELREKIASLRHELDMSNRKVTEFEYAQNWQDAQAQSTKSRNTADKLNNLLTQVDQYELRVANALWAEKSYLFQQSYLDTVSKFYHTGGVFGVDFKNNFEPAREQINHWVEDQTNKRIRDLLPKGSIDDNTRLVLTNAVYFKGEWKEPFEAGSTKDDDFTSPHGKVRVPMMHRYFYGDARYAAFNADGSFFATPAMVPASGEPDPKTVYPGEGGFTMAELPYKGGELSMVVIVPQEVEGLPELEKKLTAAKVKTWIDQFKSREVEVFLPKFKLETDYQMKDTLTAMGMARAFVDPRFPNGAQFDGMSGSQDPMQKLYIAKVIHKAFVEVNEKGAEAAAATAVSMAAPTAAPFVPQTRPFTPTFRADKPFRFAIRDVKSGTILFLGRMMDPK